MVRSFLQHEGLLRVINKSFNILIPKKDEPENISHFRTIGLCMKHIKLYPKVWPICRLILPKIILPNECFY